MCWIRIHALQEARNKTTSRTYMNIVYDWLHRQFFCKVILQHWTFFSMSEAEQQKGLINSRVTCLKKAFELMNPQDDA